MGNCQHDNSNSRHLGLVLRSQRADSEPDERFCLFPSIDNDRHRLKRAPGFAREVLVRPQLSSWKMCMFER